MSDLNLNELRATAQRLAGRTHGLKGDRLTVERAIAGDHFAPEVVLALLDRVAELEAKVTRVDAEYARHVCDRDTLAATVERVEALLSEWDQWGSLGQLFATDLRAALAGDSDD